MSILQQQLVSFAVEGKEIPVSLSSFKELSIVSNISQKLPTLRFIYNDPANYLIDNPLTDGTKIAAVLHSNVASDPEQPIEFTFRAMGAEYTPTGNRFMVRCAGIFDKMQYMTKIQRMPEQGNSSEVIKKLAGQAGFGKFSIPDSTSDKMWWRPNPSQNMGHFINTIAKHGFLDKQSIMSLGVSDNGTLHYKNVTKIINSGGGSRVVTEVDRYDASKGDIPLLGWSIKAMGGATNMLTGYGSEVKQENLQGSADEISDMVMPLLNGALNMSSSLQGIIGDVSRIFVPTKLNNQHEKYYEAREQNMRGQQQLQSTKIEFMTNMATGLDIFDKITFKPHNPIDNTPIGLFTGDYMITSKTRYFKGAQMYREKFTACASSMGASKGQVGFKEK